MYSGDGIPPCALQIGEKALDSGLEIRLEKPCAGIQGRLLEISGSPIEKYVLAFYPQSECTNCGSYKRAISNEDGTFWITDLPIGNYKMRAYIKQDGVTRDYDVGSMNIVKDLLLDDLELHVVIPASPPTATSATNSIPTRSTSSRRGRPPSSTKTRPSAASSKNRRT